MPITIYFRGIQVIVKGADDTVKEILFPNAEASAPPEALPGTDGGLNHADDTPARLHFAGALIISRNGQQEHRSLLGRRVDFPLGLGTTIPAGFADEFPSLKRATNNGNYSLSLLPEEERERGRVSARIVLRGASLEPVYPTYNFNFEMPGHFGPSVPPRPYAIGAKWSTSATLLKLRVHYFAGLKDRDIDLDDGAEVFFYCFEKEKPTKNDLLLEDPQKCVDPPIVDHDFKWIYQLMNRRAEHANWRSWLTRKRFPAPQTDCTREAEDDSPQPGKPREGLQRDRLIPVSTCYGIVDDGP